jgi:hypothetical protein
VTINTTALTDYITSSSAAAALAAATDRLHVEMSAYRENTICDDPGMLSVTGKSESLGGAPLSIIEHGQSEPASSYALRFKIDDNSDGGFYTNTQNPYTSGTGFAGRKFTFRFKIRGSAANGSIWIGFGFAGSDRVFDYFPAAPTEATLTTAFQEIQGEIVLPETMASSFVYARPRVFVQGATNGATVDVTDLAVFETTQEALPNLVGDITDIQALSIDALTGTALGTFLTQLSVGSDGTSATVTNQGSAIADLEGYVTATANLTAETSGGQISGIRATVYDGEDRQVRGQQAVLVKADPALQDSGLGAEHGNGQRHGPDASGFAAVAAIDGATQAEPGQLRQRAKDKAEAEGEQHRSLPRGGLFKTKRFEHDTLHTENRNFFPKWREKSPQARSPAWLCAPFGGT